jgi:hypothetical protein
MIHTEQKKYNVKISIEENVYETIYGMFGNDLPTIKRFLENFAKFHHAKNKSIVASKKMIEEFYYSAFLDGDLFHNCYEALMVRIKANFYVLWNKCQLKMFQDLAYKKITNYDQLDLLQQKNISPLLEHEMVKQKKNGELSLNGDIYYQLFKGRLKHILTDYIYDSEQTKENYKDCFEWI